MKTSRAQWIRTSILLRLTALALASGASACNATQGGEAAAEQQKEPPVAAAPVTHEKWCLQLSAARPEVALGEPLTLLIELQNCSGGPQSGRNLIAPEYGLLIVLYQRPGEPKPTTYMPAVRRDGRGAPTVKLEPRQSLYAVVPAYFGRDGWLLQEPGRYQFTAEYPLGTTVITSPTLTVTVLLPKGAHEGKAAEAFMAPDVSRFFYLGGGTDSNAMRAIVERFPETKPAAYARYALALNDAGSAATRRAESCDSLTQALSAIDDWIIAVRGYRALSNCLTATGRGSEADAAIRSFVERHPQARDLTMATRR